MQQFSSRPVGDAVLAIPKLRAATAGYSGPRPDVQQGKWASSLSRSTERGYGVAVVEIDPWAHFPNARSRPGHFEFISFGEHRGNTVPPRLRSSAQGRHSSIQTILGL